MQNGHDGDPYRQQPPQSDPYTPEDPYAYAEPYADDPYAQGGDYNSTMGYESYPTEDDQVYFEPGAAFEPGSAYDPIPQPAPAEDKRAEVISTSQAINLTTTIASVSTLLSIFLLFADQRSKAVRRFAVQSAGLGICHIAAGLLCYLFAALLGGIPLVGQLLGVLLIMVFIAVTGLVVYLRVRMMLHAYRGMAYVLPVIGQRLRKFE